MDASGFILPTFPQKLQLIILRGIKLKAVFCSKNQTFLGTCQKLAGGRGVETEGGSQLFETQKREGS